MNSKNRNCQFYLICLLCFLSMAWSSLYISLFLLGDDGVSVPFKILAGIMDGAIGLLPLILFRGKWRFLELLPAVLIPLVALANVLFFRNYGDMIPRKDVFYESDCGSYSHRSGAGIVPDERLFASIIACCRGKYARDLQGISAFV